MNAKKSLIIFGVYAVWLAGVVLSFAHASQIVGENLTNGLLWFGGSLLFACAGIFVALKINK